MAGNVSEDNDQNFARLVKGVVQKAQTETKCESSDKLRDVIKTQVETWLNGVEEINPLYKISELIPVGSYAEGTKIIQPDEFDYLAVIEEFSKPDTIKIDADKSNIQEGLVKVVVVDEELKSKCSGLCNDGHLQCFQPVNYPKQNQERFGHVLIKYLSLFARSSKQEDRHSLITISPTEVDGIISLPTENNDSFYFQGAQFSAPNVLIKFQYNKMDVGVDVSPAMRYHDIKDCFIETDCAGPSFADLVLRRSSLLLVGTSFESDFKVTVTEAEVEYIQKVMRPEHKIIYIFLKYILNLYANVYEPLCDHTFTSYMMKTVCIHHDVKCRMKEEGSIRECFMSVVNDLNECTRQGYVESIVNKHIHIDKRMIEKSDREFLLLGIQKIFHVSTDVNTVEDFDIFLKELVYNEGQKKVVEAQEIAKQIMESAEKFAAEANEKIAKIVDMGFTREEAMEALNVYGPYDVDYAIRILLRQRARMFHENEALPRNDLPALPKAEEENDVILYQRHKVI